MLAFNWFSKKSHEGIFYIAFMVVVDDFGILHGNDDSRERFFEVLRLQYAITTDLTGFKYLGIDIVHNLKNDTVSLSMPG